MTFTFRDRSQVPLTTSHNKGPKLSVHRVSEMTQAHKPGLPNLLLIKTRGWEHWLKPDVLWAGAHCPNTADSQNQNSVCLRCWDLRSNPENILKQCCTIT